jgi:MoaA/NifB/PqqE/SkfB family radical SAM enzyme
MHRFMGQLLTLSRWLFTERPTSAAIDITQRCNLQCLHCYWWREEQPPELDDGRMVDFMKGLRGRGLRAALIYGGEPTLRLELCREAGRIFDTTLVFTNGTNGFPPLDGAQWILSLDGPREVNDRIRGEGVFDTAVENLFRAHRPPIVHMTISRLNQDFLEPFVAQMVRLPVKGVGFSFVTPSLGSGDPELAIPLPERDRLVMQLVAHRHRYGSRVGFTQAMAQQLLSYGDYGEWNRYDLCPVSKRVLCFRADGQSKPCTYGEDADCSRCGCAAVVAYRGAFRPLHLRTLAVIAGLMAPGIGKRHNTWKDHGAQFPAKQKDWILPHRGGPFGGTGVKRGGHEAGF